MEDGPSSSLSEGGVGVKAHDFPRSKGHSAKLFDAGRQRAETRLVGARAACDAAAEASWDDQYRATQELLHATAEAKEWGVYS